MKTQQNCESKIFQKNIICDQHYGPCSNCCSNNNLLQSSVGACSGAETETIPQNFSIRPMPVCKKELPKRTIRPLIMEPTKRLMIQLPNVQVVKKIKAGILYSTCTIFQRNGTQDELPQWYLLGSPYQDFNQIHRPTGLYPHSGATDHFRRAFTFYEKAIRPTKEFIIEHPLPLPMKSP